jgi:hypothetical protein
MVHELKILPQYFKAVADGSKTFEIRKNDRDYKTGDILVLKEYENGAYTGREITKEISYILKDAQPYGLHEGYCIASLKQNGIALHNIDLTGISFTDELSKRNEEFKEFTEALLEYLYESNEKNRKHLLEETCDNIQVLVSVLEQLGIDIPEITEHWNTEHLEKIKSRPREKKCSKCINCELTEYTDRKSVLFCHQGIFVTTEDRAKECKCYEEVEE